MDGNYIVGVGREVLDGLVEFAVRDGIEKILAGAQIYRDGKLLLLVRAAGEFMEGLVELPSGGLDEGESLVEGLVREVKEETGLEVLEIKTFVDSFDYVSGTRKKARQFNFWVKVGNGEVVLNPHEHSKYMFVDPESEQMKNLGVSEAVRESIIKAGRFRI